MNSPGSIFHFGLFEFNPRSGELRKRGMKIPLSPQALKLLLTLLECPGQLRSRKELRQRLWQADTFVDFEHSLNKAIHALRRALGDAAQSPRYIETVARQGYRFIHESNGRVGTEKNRRKIESLAVLPFASQSADPEVQFLIKRIVLKVIDTISETSGIRVLAYSSVRGYQGKDLDPHTIGQDLGVRALIVGELFRVNDDLLLHVELIDVSDGSQLSGGQFEEAYSDVRDHPEKLAERISCQLRRILVPNTRRRRQQQPERAA
jgi:DNA-binding winged helix-turn-helix (wHTH) protein